MTEPTVVAEEGVEEKRPQEVLSESEDGGDHEPETAEEDAFMFKPPWRRAGPL